MRIIEGDVREGLRDIPAGSVDAVVSDPPYAEVDRSYGRLSEAEWMALMQEVVGECRRVLKSQGSAVFILQPNFERLGKMRLWVWRFLLWAAEEWNLVQDAYWWNYTTMLGAGVQRQHGFLRASVKPCIWLGEPDCYRNQDAVLWRESDANFAQRMAYRAGESHSGVQPSGHSRDRGKHAGAAAARNPDRLEYHPSGAHRVEREIRGACATREHRPSGWSVNVEKSVNGSNGRGLVTPFNLIPVSNSDSTHSAGAYGHGAGTPLALCRFWVCYLCPPGGMVLDPFSGLATVGLAAKEYGCDYLGIEKEPEYVHLSRERLAKVPDTLPGLYAPDPPADEPAEVPTAQRGLWDAGGEEDE